MITKVHEPQKIPKEAVRVCFVIDRLSRVGTEIPLLLEHFVRNRLPRFLCSLGGKNDSICELEPDDVPILRLNTKGLKSPHFIDQGSWRHV